jgi:hypothetical protein
MRPCFLSLVETRGLVLYVKVKGWARTWGGGVALTWEYFGVIGVLGADGPWLRVLDQVAACISGLQARMHGEGESELMAEPNSVVWGVMFPSYSYIEIT